MTVLSFASRFRFPEKKADDRGAICPCITDN